MIKISEESKKILKNNDAIIKSIREENEAYFIQHDRKKKFLILTYGCQMNEHDSEKLSSTIEQMGYEATPFQEDADLIIVNTCCVRENAELKVYGKVGSFKTLKEKNPNLILVVCGCMMQQEHVVTEIKRKYRHIDIVFGTHNVHNFPALLQNSYSQKKTLIQVWDIDGEVIEGMQAHRKYKLKAYVNIMYGCNNFCTYCIVPYTRGRERSRDRSVVLDEIRNLVANGTREVTLLGQNVNSYGKTFEPPISFAEFLEEVSQIEGLERIKFMTSHPKDLSNDLLHVIERHDNIANHLHLPIQAGSNKLLKSMNRGYTKEQYLDIVHTARELMPDITVSTDLIIGFPGETEEDVNEIIELIREVRYDSAYTFMFSQRKGTPADEMTDQIPDDIKHDRFNRILHELNTIVIEKNRKMKDKVVSVLVEGYSDKENTLTGRSAGSKIVNFNGDESLIGKFVDVKITNPRKFSLYGEIIKNTEA